MHENPTQAVILVKGKREKLRTPHCSVFASTSHIIFGFLPYFLKVGHPVADLCEVSLSMNKGPLSGVLKSTLHEDAVELSQDTCGWQKALGMFAW